MTDQPQKPKRPERLFSIEEANNLIPDFTRWFSEIQVLRQTIVNIVESKNKISRGNGNILSDIVQNQQDLVATSNAVERISELIESINKTGAEFRDLDGGMIDFLHLRNGRKVYLCWTMGEEKIGFWREIESDATGRQPL